MTPRHGALAVGINLAKRERNPLLGLATMIKGGLETGQGMGASVDILALAGRTASNWG